MLIDARKCVLALQAEMDAVKNTLVEQPVASFDIYHEYCGRYAGLKHAIAILKKQETTDEDDDK